MGDKAPHPWPPCLPESLCVETTSRPPGPLVATAASRCAPLYRTSRTAEVPAGSGIRPSASGTSMLALRSDQDALNEVDPLPELLFPQGEAPPPDDEEEE